MKWVKGWLIWLTLRQGEDYHRMAQLTRCDYQILI